VYFLLQGRIKVLVLSAQGKEAATGLIEPGQFFGEDCLVGDDTRSATTIAMQDCLVAPIGRTRLNELLRAEPDFADLFMRHLLLRNRRIEEDLRDQLFNCSEKRLARLLLRLTERDEDGRPQPIAQHISQEMLAEMIGTTRSRVSYFMNKFRRLGLISYDRTIEVHPARLHAMLQDQSELNGPDA
jgi:CRP-like cAMP-binding protein